MVIERAFGVGRKSLYQTISSLFNLQKKTYWHKKEKVPYIDLGFALILVVRGIADTLA